MVELGCGLGVPSLVAAHHGAEVVATDWAADALELLRRNAERNGVALRTRLCLASCSVGRQSLPGNAFPGGAWERGPALKQQIRIRIIPLADFLLELARLVDDDHALALECARGGCDSHPAHSQQVSNQRLSHAE